MLIKLVVKMLIVCLSILSISGCSEKKPEPCVPIIKYVKPDKILVPEASITQCKFEDTLDNVKCALMNYIEVKKERDMLRTALDELTQD